MDIKEILERIALPARSGKKGFKVTEKLETIQTIVEENSPYRLISKSSQAWIFGKEKPAPGTQTFLISSHADIVDAITSPFSEYLEEEHYFKGTYDNLGTNAACVSLMLKGELPENTYFAFTADEETGRCNGANQALTYMRTTTGISPTIFALDVTEEGYEHDRLFTVEGLHAVTEEKRREMLELFMGTEGEEQSFEVVRLKKKDDNSFLPEAYQASDLAEYDESAFYAKRNCNSCSICLPGDGFMHSNSGFYIKEPAMEGYILSLTACILAFTNGNQTKIEEIKREKDRLVNKNREIAFHKFHTTVYSDSCYGDYRSSYEYYDDQIPGQISLREYEEMFDSDNGDVQLNDPFMLDEYLGDFFEAASMYDSDQFDVFYSDMIYGYGLKREDSLEEYFREIFTEVHEDYDEDYDDYE